MLTQELAQERSSAGAAFFDVAFPSWHSCIGTEQLSVAHSDSCILGQMCGSFGNGQRYFHIDDIQAEKLGVLIMSLPSTEKTEGYRLLTEAWRERVAERRTIIVKEVVRPQSKYKHAVAIVTTAAISILSLLCIR